MRPMAGRPVDTEIAVELDAAVGLGIDLDHPTVEAFGVELRVDRAVERVGEVNAAAVAANLDHLRSTIERCGAFGVRSARHDPADPQLAGQPRIERIADIVLLEITGAPARHVEKLVVDREIDVGNERRASLE